MTGKELTAHLADLGWSQGELGRRVSDADRTVHRNTVSRWCSAASVPGPVAAYVRLIVAVRALPV